MKNSMEVGHELADILVDWNESVAKPTPEDLASAIMHALERFSTTVEGSKESYLGGFSTRSIIKLVNDKGPYKSYEKLLQSVAGASKQSL